MKTIYLSLDEALLALIDRTVLELGKNRSRFMRSALQSAVHQHAVEKLEERHTVGYGQQPADDADVLEWAGEQVWDET